MNAPSRQRAGHDQKIGAQWATRLLLVGLTAGPGLACSSVPTPANKSGALGQPALGACSPGAGDKSLEGSALTRCLAVDPDRDGIEGARDACPDIAETKNDFRDEDGCADEPIVSDAQGQRMRLDPALSFVPDTAKLSAAASSQLAEFARFLSADARRGPIEIAVYEAEGQGAWLALSLSRKRGAAIQAALLTAGLSGAAISVRGYGDFCADTHTAPGKDAPRVDIRPMQTDLNIGVASGCSAASRSGLLTPPASSAPLARPSSNANATAPAALRPGSLE